ncbi:MAG: histidinol-phosphate transaminase [Casimicrobiaceae bacterium]|nr:histidinol-phosphate transaminase [Casimicrobiaceae bacterium]
MSEAAGSLPSRELRERVERTLRPVLAELAPYPVSPPWPGIKLELMENNLLDPVHRTPELLALRARLAERISHAAFNRYPDPQAPRLKALLRERFKIDPAWEILLGNGSDEIIELVTRATAACGGTVLAPEPTFSVFRHAALACGARFVGVSLRPDFSLDEQALLAAVEREEPELIWLVYPNNPTGNLYARDAVERVIAAAPGLVVIDEAYEAFSGGASFLPELARYPQLLVMRTLSKIGLAGVRLGYLIGRGEWLNAIDKLRGPFNVSVLAQTAGEVLLEAHALLEEQARTIIMSRERLTAALAELPGVIPFPSHANFVLARFPDSPKVFEALKARGILVRDLSRSHPLMHNTLRLSIGTPEEIEALIGALREILTP